MKNGTTQCFAFVACLFVAISNPAIAETPAPLASGMSVKETLSVLVHKGQGDSRVALLLRSGNQIEGSPLEMNLQTGTSLVRHSDGTTSVVQLSEIASLRILDPGSAKVALQGNKLYRESEEAPTTLAFKRRLEQLRRAKPTAIIASLNEQQLASDDCRYYSSTFLDALEKEVSTIAGSSFGQEALAKHGNAITVITEDGASLSVTESENRITVGFDCMKAPEADFAAELAKRLNEKL